MIRSSLLVLVVTAHGLLLLAIVVASGRLVLVVSVALAPWRGATEMHDHCLRELARAGLFDPSPSERTLVSWRGPDVVSWFPLGVNCEWSRDGEILLRLPETDWTATINAGIGLGVAAVAVVLLFLTRFIRPQRKETA